MFSQDQFSEIQGEVSDGIIPQVQEMGKPMEDNLAPA